MRYMKPKREFYIPKGAVKVAPKGVDVVFYIFQNKAGQPCAMAFVGKAQKPTWHYRFSSIAAREKRMAELVASVKARADENAKRRAARNKPHNLGPGVIMYTSWGYEQTNVEFFEVIEAPSACFVVLQEIAAPLVNGEEGFMSGRSFPDPERKIGKPIRRKVSMNCGSPTVSIDSVRTAWVWDGREKRVSWYA